MAIVKFINKINTLGIKLWLENKQLKFKAPKGAWTDKIRDELIANKEEVIAFLRQTSVNAQIPPILPIKRSSSGGELTSEQYPLSFSQERLWFIDQLEPDSANYNIPIAVSISGELDFEHLEQAFNMIITRHENLRTIFPSKNGKAQQLILENMGFKLERSDLSHIEHEEMRYQKAEELCQLEARTPFNLSKGPLVRAKVFRLNVQKHILMLNMHHIISDGWSMGVMVKEFALIMDTLRQGKTPNLPPLPIQYLDYSVWQRNWLSGKNPHGDLKTDQDKEDSILQQQLNYWKQQLDGAPESLNLASDFPRPGVQSYSGARHVFSLDTQITKQLKSLAEQQGCTLFMVLLTVFKVLLYRYSNQEDICIGSPVATRQYEGTESLIGLFITTLVLRSQVEGNSAFSSLLSTVRKTCLDAFENQDTPFEKIVDLVQPHRNAAISPLFQVMFILQNSPRESLGGGVEAYSLEIAISKFDITLEFNETSDGLEGAIEYRTELFKQQTIERMAEHLRAVCQVITTTPGSKIRDLEFIGETEKQQLLIDYNNTQSNYPKDKCIHQLFKEQVISNPDKIAVEYQGETLSYQQLYNKSYQLALYLQSLGVQPDSLVGLCVERSLEMMIGILGILQAGGAYVPLDPDYPDDRLAYMLEDSGVAIVLSQKKLLEKLSGIITKDAQLIALDMQWTEICDRVTDLKTKQVKLRQEVKPEHLAYMIYTSGSTGQPKGVMVEHKSLVNHNNYAGEKYQITKTDKQLLFSSMNFDLFIEEVFVILNNGAQLVIEQKDNLLTLQYFKELIKSHNITVLNIPTAFFHQLVVSDISLGSVKNVIIGGEKLEYSKAQKFTNKFPDINLYNTYGPTETTIISTVMCVTKELISQHNAALIGGPIYNTQIYILDQYNNLVPMGAVGELHIAGDGLARGYLNRTELTKEKFIPNPFNPGTRMYKSGDLARWLDDGNIEYLGRIDTQVKIRGFRIEMGEIEAQLNQYPEIKDSVIIAQGQEGDKKLIAYYLARETKEENLINLAHEDLRAYLQQSLPEYMLPVAFISLEAIPLTPNDKVDRRALELMDVSIESSQVYLAPSNAIEKQLVAIWAEVLNIKQEKVGVNDNFFELGGDSIKTIQIVSKAIEHHIYFDIRDMFNHQNIHDLLKYCDTTKSREIIKEEGILQGVVELSPIQSDFFEHIQTDAHYFNQAVVLNMSTHISIQDLQELINQLVEHHDVLRLRYTKDNNAWQQRYLGSVSNTPEALGIHSYDITEFDEKQVSDYIEKTCNYWQARLDLENGPIMRWIYFDSKSNSCDQLAIIIHHLVIDGVSWRILLEDFNQLIGQQLTQKSFQLSQKRSSYRNWVDSLANYKDTNFGQKDLAFWLEQSKKMQNINDDFENKAYRNQDILHERVLLSKINTEKLLKHCHQAYGTEINDLLMTAVMLSYYQSTGNKKLIVDLEGHGREQNDPAIDITKTVGWFTSLYPVVFELLNPQDIGRSIKDIKTALHEIPNKGVGFSIFRYVNQHETIKNIPESRVAFNFLGDFQSIERKSTDNYFSLSKNSSGNASSEQQEVNKIVTINGLVVFEQLSFTFSYPEEWQGQKISHWQTYFISALEALIEHCDDSSRMGYTPSDFPLFTSSLTQLDKLILRLNKKQDIKLNNVQDIYPLTSLQSGILFETLYAESQDNKGMYLTQTAVGIKGQADLKVMQQAWQSISNHYDALRMLVIPDGAEGLDIDLQVILKQVEIKINRVDWTDKTHSELKSACEQWMKESKSSGINLYEAPLMRISLFQGQESFYMLFEQHHIVMDGWSQGIVLGNLFKIYQALEQQKNYELPPCVPHKSYVQAFLNRDQEEEVSYWKKYLAYHEERTPLPMSQLSSQWNISRDVFDKSIFCLSHENSIKLEGLIKKHRLTMNTVLQFIWGLLLHLHSGNKTITFGSVSSGRTGIHDIKQGDQIVGLCINTTPTCIRFNSDLRLLEQLKQMQNIESEKLNYEVTPLVSIQELLGIKTNEDFFQTLFVYENYPVEKISEANNIIIDFIGNEAPNYPLTISAASQDKLTISFTYDGYYYNEDTIITLMEQFERITLQLIEDPEVSIKEVSLISAHEKQQLLTKYNQTQTDYPKDKCIHQLFTEQLDINPGKIAAVYQGETLSFQQLYDKSYALALYLQSLGVKPDSLVGLCVERSLETIVGILGILQAGGAYVPLDPNLPNERLAYMLVDSQTDILLTQEKLQKRLSDIITEDTRLITLDKQWSEIDNKATDLKVKQVKLQQEVKASHLAYVIYTSGSTGQPKGVEVEHSGVVAFLSNPTYVDITKTNKVASFSSFAFDGFVFDLFLSLSIGSSLYLYNSDDYLQSTQFQKNIQQDEIDTFFVTTALFNQLVGNDSLRNSSIKQILFGGENCDLSYVEKFKKDYPEIRLMHVYGPTETIVYASCCELNNQTNIAPIGTAINNNKLVVLNYMQQLTPVGGIGELYIGGDSLARGYLNRPELTAERFIANPYYDESKPDSSARLYCTGDLVRILPDGNLVFIGRTDAQVKVRGYRIELGEIEALLNQYPEIKDSVVIAKGAVGNKQLIGYYVARETTKNQLIDLANAELKKYLQQTLPEYMLPVAFVSIDTIPLTPNGKVDRRALERIDVSLESSRVYLAPRNETEKQLVAIWAEVLKLDPEKLGVNDNFFELGGHSLLVTQVISKISSQLEVKVPLKALFSANTLAGVAEVCLAIKAQHEKPTLNTNLTNVEFEETFL